MPARLKQIRQGGWVLIVEGREAETNALTLWFHDLPALGASGNWQSEWKHDLTGIEVFVWQGDESFSGSIARDIPDAKIIIAPADTADISDAHIKGENVRDLVEQLRRQAIPIERLRRRAAHGLERDLREQAATILNSDDPLALVRSALRDVGYGGDLRAPTLVYLSVTTRLLKIRWGAMPAHILVLGPSSVGKSYAVQTAKKLLPHEVMYTIDAGSPAVFIYESDYDFRHKAAFFSEADSLPAGEDNPIASAVRNLLQDNLFKYKRTVPDGTAPGGRRVVEIVHDGPTVLITTSTRKLGHQLDTRLFTVEAPEDAEQVKSALDMQASLELGLPGTPDPALIAFQQYLQILAPWDVIVPFMRIITGLIGESPNATRILRDVQKIMSLIKAVTLLRRERRSVNREGQLVAGVDDYAEVHRLVEGMYEATITNIPQDLRKLIQAVTELRKSINPVSQREVANKLGWTTMRVSRWTTRALKEGWLHNDGSKQMFDLVPGKELPDQVGLPSPTLVEQLYEQQKKSVGSSLITRNSKEDQ